MAKKPILLFASFMGVLFLIGLITGSIFVVQYRFKLDFFNVRTKLQCKVISLTVTVLCKSTPCETDAPIVPTVNYHFFTPKGKPKGFQVVLNEYAPYNSDQAMRHAMKRFPPGLQVPCWYDPEQPEEPAELNPPNPALYFQLFTLIFGILLGVPLLFGTLVSSTIFLIRWHGRVPSQ